jgi:uncharacterized membrane protein YkvA (DUF1232 family)
VKLLAMFNAVRHKLPRVIPLMRDDRVPLWAKFLAILAAVLIVSPIDLLGDIPVLGLFDDAALLLFVVHLFVTFAEKRARIGSGAIVVN